MLKQQPRLAVIGAGAMGCLWATRLQDAWPGAITLWTRTSQQQQVLQVQGIRVTGPCGKEQHYRLPIASTEGVQKVPSYDLVLVAVKTPALAHLIPILQTGITPQTVIIFIQNGFVAYHQPEQGAVYAAVITEGATARGVGVIRCTGQSPTRVGPLCSAHPPPPVLHKLLSTLAWCYDPHIRRALWEKWVLSSVILPLTACYGIRNGWILQLPYRAEAEVLLQEALAVGERLQFVWDWQNAWQALVSLCERTYHNFSSMLQDVARGSCTEIASINGAMVKTAGQVGLSVPQHERIAERIRIRETVTQREKFL